MHTEDLRAFFAVVEHGSLTAAARRLEIPKSTLGRRITRLEEELDAQLVLRTPRRTQVTQIGQRLYSGGEPLLSDLDGLRSQLLDRPTAPQGVVRIASPKDVATTMLGALVARLLRDHAKLEVDLVASNASVDMLGDGFDAALRIHFGELPDHTSLKVRRLRPIHVGLFASPHYLEAHGAPRTPTALQRHTLLGMAALSTPWRLHRERDGKTMHAEGNVRFRSNDHHALLDAASSDAGVVSLPGFVAANAVSTGTLIPVLPTWTLQSAVLSLVWPSTRHVSPRLRAFIDTAVEHFRLGGERLR
jgi:DNA-binding transcriptional LysR family regulator